MSIKQELENGFTQLEIKTVSSSFGGPAINGRAPNFTFGPILVWLESVVEHCDEPLKSSLQILREKLTPKAFRYTLQCLGRFSFCIELTNLGITSTKMKTRWMTGLIMKTVPGNFTNVEGYFSPGEDERSSSFEDCYAVFCQCAAMVSNSNVHLEIMTGLAETHRRGTSYEAVFTYENKSLAKLHVANNIRLVNTEDVSWLVQARPIIRPTLTLTLIKKIQTKSYKTDRSQTGEVQTNRAKRWECLTIDFQHATIEECWSVERKLLSDIVNFQGYPEESKRMLRNTNLFHDNQETTACPITFQPMMFNELMTASSHGESPFQVGHMAPLKNGGNHQGGNIQWISQDGNRIQGSLSVQETRNMLVGIFDHMRRRGLL